jgi:hypothetical protein
MMNFRILPRFAAALVLLFAALIPLRALASPAAGYWWNPASPGSGFVIEIQGNSMFMAGFLYDASGNASWVASSGPMTTPTQYSGSLITYHGGQTLTGAYQPATLTSPAIGTISINFATDTTGTVNWPGGSNNVTVPIQRFDIVPGGSTATQPATNPQTGWWWNESEGGRGFAIEVQGGTMYFAGYMYDVNGNPTWYLAYGPMTNTSLFQGEWQQYSGGPTLTGPYKSPGAPVNAGSVTLQVANNSVATLTLPDGRQIPFTRFEFGGSGFALQAFAPSASAPAQLLKITGSGFDPAQALSLTLSDSNGYSVTIPPVTETTTQFEISVPPYVNAMTSLFGTGTVSLQATQGTIKSNSLPAFQIQPLPAAAGTPGTTTLSLIRASLSEAQKLQTSIKNTPQDSPALEDALGRQVTDLQTLVANVQSVVQQGQSFSLGTVGGVNITVTPANIADVDSLILATLQSLTSPGPGASLKSATATATAANGTCLGTEAGAFAQAAAGGNGNTDTLAVTFLEAACKSSLCQAPASFLPAYQLYSGAGSTGLGVTNQGGFGTKPVKGVSAALLSTLISNSGTSVVLNNLLCLSSSSDQSSVKTGVANVTKLQQPVYNVLLPKATGELGLTLTDGLTVSNIVAPPPPSSAGGISGTWSGTFTVASPGQCFLQFHTWIAQFTDSNGALSGSWTGNDGSSGALSGVETGTAGSWSTPGSSGIYVYTNINGNQMTGNFTSNVHCIQNTVDYGPLQGTFSGSKD